MASSASARCPMMDRTLEATMVRNLRIAIAMLTAVLKAQGLGPTAIAKTLGIGWASVYRVMGAGH
jgi:hypothetical protein